ncbi:hypothetical protein J6590_057476 [Homalodisca vitripennis]|nr:hypothetical protein J6590_057476 [Homalodisca vitripennis]
MKIWDPAYDPYSSLLDQYACSAGEAPPQISIPYANNEAKHPCTLWHQKAVKREQTSLSSTLDKVGKRDTGL